jgi:hypothetical protein
LESSTPQLIEVVVLLQVERAAGMLDALAVVHPVPVVAAGRTGAGFKLVVVEFKIRFCPP